MITDNAFEKSKKHRKDINLLKKWLIAVDAQKYGEVRQGMIHKVVFDIRPYSKSNDKSIFRGHILKCQKARMWEAAIGLSLARKWRRAPISAAVRVCYVFYWKNKVRGDLNNATKSLDDAFNKRVWKDDRQIVESALFCRQSARERIEVYLESVEDLVGDTSGMIDFLERIKKGMI